MTDTAWKSVIRRGRAGAGASRAQPPSAAPARPRTSSSDRSPPTMSVIAAGSNIAACATRSVSRVRPATGSGGAPSGRGDGRVDRRGEGLLGPTPRVRSRLEQVVEAFLAQAVHLVLGERRVADHL